jgi:predicted transcriptional regulator
MKELDIFQEHRFKPLISYFGIKQIELARTLNISQSALSNMLNGFVPMKDAIEQEISELIKNLREKRKVKKYKKIIKKKDA